MMDDVGLSLGAFGSFVEVNKLTLRRLSAFETNLQKLTVDGEYEGDVDVVGKLDGALDEEGTKDGLTVGLYDGTKDFDGLMLGTPERY